MNTPEVAKAYLPFVQALADGKTVQWKNGGHWVDITGANNFSVFGSSHSALRIKPEPKLRAWRPEEIPTCARIRVKSNPRAGWGTILSFDENAQVITGSANFFAGLKHAAEHWEHSTDNGKTWHPCGILE